MQQDAKTLYQAIGKIVRENREEKGIKYTLICYENDIPMSTYDVIEKGQAKSSFYNIAKVIGGLGLTFEEFGALLDKELPANFLKFDKDN